MGNHASHSSGERRLKDVGAVGGSQPTRTDRPRLESQVSDDDHEPVFMPKSPEAKEVPVRYTAGGNRKMLPCVIKWTGGGDDVHLAGEFNSWKKIKMVKSEKDFVAIVDLPEGNFEYKFKVDGEWKVSQDDQKVTNDEGIENNVIAINEADFAELENELLNDPNDLNVPDPFSHGSAVVHKTGEDPNAGYGQVVPEYKPNEKTRDPPVLPPHLLQVILNKDTPVSCEPTLLPEPNHVIVNHMYALSIRDGMMVLSTTHRYQKKSVTTLIYRPI